MSELLVKGGEISPQVTHDSSALISMIERVCLNPDADPAKLEKMIDMQERILNRNAEQAFAADFAAMQADLPRIARNGTIEIKKDGRVIQSTPFAKLEDINDGVRPVLQKYGFGVSFNIEQANQLVTVTAKLLHRLGHSEKTSISLPNDNSGSKNAVQGTGSSVSYGKRYALCALLNISTGEDTDGWTNQHQIARQEVKQTLQPISDERLAKAIAKIKSGEYMLESLMANYALTDRQKEIISIQLNQGEA